MPRRSIDSGEFVEFSPEPPGHLAAAYHHLTRSHVMLVEAVIPPSVYGRKAFQVVCGDERLILWPCQIRLVRHPKVKKRKKAIA